MNKPKFTREQQYYICQVIGDWYLEWKYKIVDPGVLHKLGFAKEKLKEMFCSKELTVEDTVFNLGPSLSISNPPYFTKDGKKYQYVCKIHKVSSGVPPISFAEDSGNWKHFCIECIRDFHETGLSEIAVIEYVQGEGNESS